jgi:predicted acyltransferase
MRLTSLDVFRGLTIAGMILVNITGIADSKYALLDHADWNGCTLADLVFPFFLFAVGLSMAFSLPKQLEKSKNRQEIYSRIVYRSALLFLIGLFLNGFWNKGAWTFDLGAIRLMGILQRIALAYFFTSFIVLLTPARIQWLLASILLIGYWLAMMYVPVPDYGAGVLTRDGNLGAYVDRLLIPTEHLYRGDNYKRMGDPEGIFGTIPAIVSALAGYFVGVFIRKKPHPISKTSLQLFLFGLTCLGIGLLWDIVFPISKKLWSSSYVVFTTGWALVAFAVCYELIEVRAIRAWSKIWEIMGLNAIALFIAHILVIKILVKTNIGNTQGALSTYDWLYQNVFAVWASPLNGSLIFGLAGVLLCMLLAVFMYRQRWFVKI